MPEQIISDRGMQYVAQFMKDLHKLTNTTTNISTAYHPQTDGQLNGLIKKLNNTFIYLFIINRQTGTNGFLAQNSHTTTKFKRQLASHHSMSTKDDILVPMYVSVTKDVKSQSAIEFA